MADPFTIDHLDHLVLTVENPDATLAFYVQVLGMEKIEFNGRVAVRFGAQKINLHAKGHEFEPKAERPTPGSGDLCFITKVPLEVVLAHLAAKNVVVEEGPVEKTGAVGKIRSVYVRDPDHNLIEISNYL